MTGLEFLLLLAVVYAAAAPDPLTLAATRGATGAARAVAGRRAASRPTTPRHTTPRRTTAPAGSSTAAAAAAVPAVSSAVRADLLGPVRAFVATAAGGWRDGVRAARQRRAEGRDVVGRVRRAAAGLAGRVRSRRPASSTAPASSTPASTSTPDSWAPAEGTTPTAPVPAPAEAPTTTTEEPRMTTMQSTELESLDAVQAEARSAAEAVAEIQDVLTSLQGWASALPDRWSGTDWSTNDLDAAVSAIGEAVHPQVDPDALSVGLDALTAAAERARAVAEVADELGATGPVDRFRAS